MWPLGRIRQNGVKLLSGIAGIEWATERDNLRQGADRSKSRKLKIQGDRFRLLVDNLKDEPVPILAPGRRHINIPLPARDLGTDHQR